MNPHADFAHSLLDPERACPAGLGRSDGRAPDSRFAVYRNNLRSGLVNALADGYPVVEQLVGTEFFRAMAAIFSRDCPPCSPLMIDYGQDFADFIQGFAPAASVPYLADMARLERLRVAACHAADQTALSADTIALTLSAPDALGHLHIGLDASLATLDSAFAVGSLWLAHQDGGQPERVDPMRSETLLILRRSLRVLLVPIDRASHRFIQALRQDLDFGTAAAQTCEDFPGFDLSACLGLLIRYGAITHLTHPERT